MRIHIKYENIKKNSLWWSKMISILISGLISGNLALWTGPCIRKSIILMCLSSSRDKFTLLYQKSVTDVSLGFRMGTNMASPTWRLHTNLYKFWWNTSANSARIKDSRDLILGNIVYIAVNYHIPDSWVFFIERLRFLVLITWLMKTKNI